MKTRVVVTGVGMITPVGLDTNSSWAALTAGQSGIGRIKAFDPAGYETQIAAEIKGFEPENYMDKKAAKNMDRFAQLAVAAATEAIRHAGLKIDDSNRTHIAVRFGSGVGGIITISEQVNTLKEKGPSRVSPFLVPKMLADMAASQISMNFGIKGSSICTVSSCCSGGDAIGESYELILRGDANTVIAGGTEAAICPIAIAGFNSCRALSTRNEEPHKASRPFDAKRDGFVLGEGSGALVLENLEHALHRGTTPIVELIGYGATSDAHHITQPAPMGEGAVRAMRMALKKANLKPNDITYINAHGTSTPINDKFETMAVKQVFGEDPHHIPPISSTKSMTGHLLGAAGAVEAVISVMAIKTGVIPPTINLENPDPECDLDYTPNQARHGKFTVTMSNSLGFGGHNTSLIFRTFEK